MLVHQRVNHVNHVNLFNLESIHMFHLFPVGEWKIPRFALPTAWSGLSENGGFHGIPICQFSDKPGSTDVLPDGSNWADDRFQVISVIYDICIYEAFLKWGSPQIINFHRIFPYKPTIWGTPIYGNHHIYIYIHAQIYCRHC